MAWLIVQPSTVNGTDLGAQEWSDALFLRYGLEPPDFPKYCDDCNTKFKICHTLDCKRGGLITAHHNELQNGLADLSGKSFTPSRVLNDPFIFAGYVVKRPRAKLDRTRGLTEQDGAPLLEDMEQKGNLLIRDLLQNGTDTVHDMHVMNTDFKTHTVKTLEK